MNTTQLIAHWTMQGAGHDVEERFRNADDVLRAVTAHHDPPVSAAEAAPLHVRGADEEDWALLQIGG